MARPEAGQVVGTTFGRLAAAPAARLARDLCSRSRGVRALFDDHLAFYGELRTGLFLEELARYVAHVHYDIARVTGGVPELQGELFNVLRTLEQRFTEGDEEIAALIGGSFVAALPPVGEPGYEIRWMLGPALSSELDRVEAAR